MAELPYLVMDTRQAANFREETAADLNALNPILIREGKHRGKFALPERVLFAEEFADRRDALRMLDVVVLDTEIAWPPEPEEDEEASS